MNCERLKELMPDLWESCCTSCHEDVEMGYNDMTWVTVGGEELEICCALSRNYGDKTSETHKPEAP